jgi:hypothetical protein
MFGTDEIKFEMAEQLIIVLLVNQHFKFSFICQ